MGDNKEIFSFRTLPYNAVSLISLYHALDPKHSVVWVSNVYLNLCVLWSKYKNKYHKSYTNCKISVGFLDQISNNASTSMPLFIEVV